MKNIILLSLILVQPLCAGLMWDRPVDISQAEVDLHTYRLSSNSKGDSIAIWTEEKIIGPIQAVTKSAGREWEGPVKLSASNGMYPKAVIDEEGTITAIWVNQLPYGNIWSATKKTGQAWENSPTALSNGFSLSPQIAIDSQGSILLIWGEKSSGKIFSRIKPVREDWSSSQEFFSEYLLSSMPSQLSFNRNGESVGVGRGLCNLFENTSVPFVITRFRDTPWSDPHALYIEENILSQLMLTGEFVCIYQEEKGTKCLIRSQEGVWETSDFPSVTKTSHLRISSNNKGSLVAVWEGSSVGEICCSTKPKGGKWQAPDTTNPLKRAISNLQIIYDDEGGMLFLFQDPKMHKFLMLTNTPQEGWSRPSAFTIGFQEERPLLKLSTSGQIVIVWRDYESKHLFASTGIWKKPAVPTSSVSKWWW